MKIAQFIHDGRPGLGLVEEGGLAPLDFAGDMLDFIAGDRTAVLNPGRPISLGQTRLAPPVTRPGKIIGIGLNYRDHAEEQNAKIPAEPRLFAKFATALIGPGDPIVWDPAVTGQVDFEAELAVVIGRAVKNCPEDQALAAVFGYTCANDVSARDIQLATGELVRGKSLDTFCPLGPWIVTADEIPEPGTLTVRCRLNGALMQEGTTAMLIFGIPALVAFLSRSFTLLPGDIILTGTPKGVGVFRNPPVFLKDGDEVAVEVEGIGRLVNTCRTA